jgi:hypothetical protein
MSKCTPFLFLSLLSLKNASRIHSFSWSHQPCATFAPCPPPRFDTFSEKLVCSWTTHEDENIVVEEVMRSCGGAVQGIREPAFFGGDDGKGGLYLNRANDGFLFFNQGEYSFGPVQRRDGDTDTFLSNFMFGRSRIAVRCETDKSSVVNPTSTFLRKTFGGTDKAAPSIQQCWETDPTRIWSVDFYSNTKCAMPSAGQPWILQRAKWERKASEVDEYSSAEDTVASLDDSIIYRCWAMSQSASDLGEWAGLGSAQPSAGQVVHMGVLCKDTGAIQALVRHYNPSGGLTSVNFLQGRAETGETSTCEPLVYY